MMLRHIFCMLNVDLCNLKLEARVLLGPFWCVAWIFKLQFMLHLVCVAFRCARGRNLDLQHGLQLGFSSCGHLGLRSIQIPSFKLQNPSALRFMGIYFVPLFA